MTTFTLAKFVGRDIHTSFIDFTLNEDFGMVKVTISEGDNVGIDMMSVEKARKFWKELVANGYTRTK